MEILVKVDLKLSTLFFTLYSSFYACAILYNKQNSFKLRTLVSQDTINMFAKLMSY